MKTIVRIDHDIPYDEYNLSYVFTWLNRLPYPVDKLYIRKSCGGNVHLKVIVSCELSPIDELFVRAVLRDDPKRLRGDMERYLFDSPLFGILFDEKYDAENRVRLKAGLWEEIPLHEK